MRRRTWHREIRKSDYIDNSVSNPLSVSNLAIGSSVGRTDSTGSTGGGNRRKRMF